LPTVPRERLADVPSRYRALLGEPSFVCLFVSQLCSLTTFGMFLHLQFILNNFVFELGSDKSLQLTKWQFLPAFLTAFVIAPNVLKMFGKKHGAIAAGTVAACLMPLPIMLQLSGAMPTNCTDGSFHAIVAISICAQTFLVTSNIATLALNADLVEESEVRKANGRNEGFLFGFQNVVDKMGFAVGGFVATKVLQEHACVKYPVPGLTRWTSEVYNPSLRRLCNWYLVIRGSLDFVALCMLFGYRIDRKKHGANVVRAHALRKDGACASSDGDGATSTVGGVPVVDVSYA